jgi:hypothetical protein
MAGLTSTARMASRAFGPSDWARLHLRPPIGRDSEPAWLQSDVNQALRTVNDHSVDHRPPGAESMTRMASSRST